MPAEPGSARPAEPSTQPATNVVPSRGAALSAAKRRVVGRCVHPALSVRDDNALHGKANAGEGGRHGCTGISDKGSVSLWRSLGWASASECPDCLRVQRRSDDAFRARSHLGIDLMPAGAGGTFHGDVRDLIEKLARLGFADCSPLARIPQSAARCWFKDKAKNRRRRLTSFGSCWPRHPRICIENPVR